MKQSDDSPYSTHLKTPHPPHFRNPQETFASYRANGGYGSEGRLLAALERWGSNKFVVPIPSFQELLWEQLLAPFFCFQVFCVGLWALDEYWCVRGWVQRNGSEVPWPKGNP